jgi:hypothetical protein
MKTFKEFLEISQQLEESSTPERSGRRVRGKLTLARGRGADMTRQERTTAAIARKAGLKGTGKYSTKDLRTGRKDYSTYDSEDDLDDIGSTEQDHYISTHASARRAAAHTGMIKKYKANGRNSSGFTKLKVAPSSESVRRVKDFRKSMTKIGADKKGRVHTIDILHRDSNVSKNDPHKRMERGKNFIQAIKDTPKHLKAAGAKKKEATLGKPATVMKNEGDDDRSRQVGAEKRGKLYKKIFGRRSTERSNKTGYMTGKVD